ncbi:hypothetical protein LTR28_001769 [Elasticomyces elasticus]|nr:hypothetical protein LTR28_001769 [Elasticomyces elasticus]
MSFQPTQSFHISNIAITGITILSTLALTALIGATYCLICGCAWTKQSKREAQWVTDGRNEHKLWYRNAPALAPYEEERGFELARRASSSATPGLVKGDGLVGATMSARTGGLGW